MKQFLTIWAICVAMVTVLQAESFTLEENEQKDVISSYTQGSAYDKSSIITPAGGGLIFDGGDGTAANPYQITNWGCRRNLAPA